MSEAAVPVHHAILELAGSVRLAGEISLRENGHLQLSAVRMLEKGQTSKLSLTLGAEGKLSLGSPNSEAADRATTSVAIAGVSGNTLELAIVEPESADTANLLQIISTEAANPSPEYPELLAKFERFSLRQLGSRMEELLIGVAGYLLGASHQPKKDSVDATLNYEAVTALRRNSDAIVQRFTEHLAKCFRDLTPPPSNQRHWPDKTETDGALNLVDLNEFEDHLAVERMSAIGEELHAVALECLIIRLAVLIDADPLKVRLPIHVAEICRGFHRALDGQGISHDVVPRIFDFFVAKFVRELGSYYEPLNVMISSHGIRPELEQEIMTKGSILQRSMGIPSKGRSEVISRPPPASQQELVQDVVAGVVERITAKFSPESLYQSVLEALNFKREIAGQQDLSGGGQGGLVSGLFPGKSGPLADSQSVVQALAGLQHSANARSEVSQGGSLSAYLAEHNEQITAFDGTSGLSPESLNQLELVDDLFGVIQSTLDVSTELKPALGNLQIPLGKLALLEPKFFLDRAHTARNVIDKLANLAASANFPNRALETQVAEIVEEIVAKYDRDSTVFDVALERVEKLVRQQAQTQSRNVERVVKTQEGKETLRKAQHAVDSEIRARVDPTSSPLALVKLIDSGWRDLLVLTYIKEGPESGAWKQHIDSLDTLSSWLREQQQGNVDEATLVQRQADAEPYIQLLEQQLNTALPGNVALQTALDELREVLAGNKPLLTTEVTDKTAPARWNPAELRSRIEKTHRLKRWVQRVEQLEEGSWLTYRDEQDQRRRIQLAWISDEKDRFIFVNERGQKVTELNAVQLARQLSQGVQPPPPADSLSLVDQSMYGTLEKLQGSLSFDRSHDSLTKLINRGTFMEQIDRALRHAHQRSSEHAVLYLNIDKFSLVNEIYDEISGDQVLLEFARLLAQLHGSKTSSARLAADEFGVLLIDQSLAQAVQVAESIRSDIEKSSIEIGDENVQFTVSIGVAPIRNYSPSIEAVVEAASAAMQLAKDRGRNQVVEFQEDRNKIQHYEHAQNEYRDDIETALETDRFVLRAQPIVQTDLDGKPDEARYYEILLALSNAEGGLDSPQEFIANAERFGFMTMVDRWVIKEAFSWINQLMDAQKVVPNISINLSGNSVTDDDFMEFLFEQISEFGVGTNRLCFEITETGTISNLVKAADFVRAFRNIGCKFSIDDFGTGLASHNYLRELPVDYVKIDGTFITGIHENRNDYAMARSINDLAHFLGQETIAESVENDQIIEKLKTIGVDYLQGWRIGRPKILAEVTRELSTIEK